MTVTMTAGGVASRGVASRGGASRGGASEHGGNIRAAEIRYGHDRGSMVDLSTGIAPRPWPVPSALFDDLHALPQDEDTAYLVKVMRQAHPIPDSAGILAAPGSEMLAGLVPRLGKRTPVALAAPVYGGHTEAWQGSDIWHYRAGDGEAFCEFGKWRSAVVVNPGNPLGEVTGRDMLLAGATHAAKSGGVLVVDEAFCDLDPGLSMLQEAGIPGLVVLRSFGKFYGLGGLRLGFAIGHVDDIAALGGMLGRWTVSSPAIAIGAMAIADGDFAASQREYLAEQSTALCEVLARHGLDRIGGTDLYHLIEHERARDMHERLARAGIWTRIYKDYPDWLRLATPAPAAIKKLDAALADADFT